jgi:hypothetical protein
LLLVFIPRTGAGVNSAAPQIAAAGRIMGLSDISSKIAMFVGQHTMPDRRGRPHALSWQIWSASAAPPMDAMSAGPQLMLAQRAGEF